jgi:hypothetical protein
MFARNVDRVPSHTKQWINDSIRRDIDARIAWYSEHPDLIPQRLRELEREWDVERCLETGSATLSLSGLILGLTRSRRWLFLPLAVQTFFLQHALQGWCPPLPLFRRLGVRTQVEIERERRALQAILGEFDPAGDGRRTRGVRGPAQEAAG